MVSFNAGRFLLCLIKKLLENRVVSECLLVPVEGVEPPWGCPRLILSQLRLPFRHTGTLGGVVIVARARLSVNGGRRDAPAARLILCLE